jgi:hypothetical protein
MRVLACTILTIATVWVAATARAQTYDPSYPVCLQTYGIDGSYIDCSFTSLAQCAASASGRGAVPDQSVFCAGRQETAAASRRLLGAAASACFGRHAQFCPCHRFDV